MNDLPNEIPHILHLFDSLSSENENERSQAYNIFEKLFQDSTFYNILFQFLSTPGLENKYYILASRCLHTWFRRNYIKPEDQNDFISKLQPFLLINHPASEELFLLYGASIHLYCSNIYVTFLGNSINLLSLETQPEILICFLRLASVISKEFVSNLDLNIKEYIDKLFIEINTRLIPIFQNVQNLLKAPVGCLIIKYSFEIFIFSVKTEIIKFNETLVPLVINSFHFILQNMSNINDNSFYILVDYSNLMLKYLRFTDVKSVVKQMKLSEEQEYSFLKNIDLLTLQFTIALAPFHLEIINEDLKLLYSHINIVPESPEFVQVLIEICALTENDLFDLTVNPAIFYEYAYSSTFRSNRRRTCFDIVQQICHKFKTGAIIRYLISQPPSEATMYLVSSLIHYSLAFEMENEVAQWIIDCANSQVPFHSPLEMSTFLYLVSRAAKRIIPNEFLVNLAPIVYEIISYTFTNVINSNISMCSQSFIIGCSQCFITVTNAVRVVRKIIDKDIFEFPPEILCYVVQLLPNFITPDAARCIKSLLNYFQEPGKKELIHSQLEAIEINLCISASSALSSIINFENNHDSNKFTSKKRSDDCQIISYSIDTINEIISCEGQTPAIRSEIISLIEILIKNLDKDFSENLLALIITIFKACVYASKQIVVIVIEALNTIPQLFYEINDIYFVLIFFMFSQNDEFIAMNITYSIVEIGMKAINLKYYDEGADLICFAIQSDHNFDISFLMTHVSDMCQNLSLFRYGIMILMSIIVSRPQMDLKQEDILSSIVQWVARGYAKCPYEKRLAALSLLILNNSDNVIKMAIELLEQEKIQRQNLSKAYETSCHLYPTPIETINIIEVAENCIQHCSEENKQIFINNIKQLYS
ncbi:hypothetical protein M9Y10_004487 [Tritrichomonas musculus]|uniref:Importin N-terminal domain-containing protein n=2 Tax=Tritrichomonas musculus TaxID=1915356 RepID=A0ABR2JSJ0_9EUKA